MRFTEKLSPSDKKSPLKTPKSVLTSTCKIKHRNIESYKGFYKFLSELSLCFGQKHFKMDIN